MGSGLTVSEIKRIRVAVGIVFDTQGRVLVGQRVVKDRYFAKWEFPGGKIEPEESVTQALVREFKEECGIELEPSKEFMQIQHDYPDRHVHLYVHTVRGFKGEVQALEGQALKWVAIEELRDLDFLQGNEPMIRKLEQDFPVEPQARVSR